MKRLFWALVCIAATGVLAAQDRIANRAFYAEFGGASLIYSANIDGRFIPAQRLGSGYRVGIGGFFGTGDGSGIVVAPLGINSLIGRSDSPHIFEVSYGATFMYNDKNTYWPVHIGFAYRRQPLNEGFMWEAGITTLLFVYKFGGPLPLPTLSLGYVF